MLGILFPSKFVFVLKKIYTNWKIRKEQSLIQCHKRLNDNGTLSSGNSITHAHSTTSTPTRSARKSTMSEHHKFQKNSIIDYRQNKTGKLKTNILWEIRRKVMYQMQNRWKEQIPEQLHSIVQLKNNVLLNKHKLQKATLQIFWLPVYYKYHK